MDNLHRNLRTNQWCLHRLPNPGAPTMNAIPHIRLVVELATVGLMYYVFNILLKEYLLPNESISDVTTSGPYPIFLMVFNSFLLIAMLVEAIRYLYGIEKRRGYQ